MEIEAGVDSEAAGINSAETAVVRVTDPVGPVTVPPTPQYNPKTHTRAARFDKYGSDLCRDFRM